MARFLFWSDLHCDVEPFAVPLPSDGGGPPEAPRRAEIDAILIPGDMDVRGRHVALLVAVWQAWRCPVLAVAGNHEAYGAKRFQKHLEEEAGLLSVAQAAGADIDVLRCGVRTIGNTRIIGATLWTDFRLWPGYGPLAEIAARDVMNDYRRIMWHDEARGIYRRMIPQDTAAMHQHEKAFILDALARPFEGRTLVMTHHLPVREMLAARRQDRREMITAAYASDLWGVIREYPVDFWICGHSHDCREVVLEGEHGPVEFLRNIRGYPGESTDFDPWRVIDTGPEGPQHRGSGPEFE